MAQLAGFDVVGEIHVETVSDLINRVQLTNPVDGKTIYLLGGPFSTDLNVDLGPLGVTPIRLLLDAEIEPVLGQPLTRFGISFQGGGSIGSPAPNHISGQVTIDVPMSFGLVTVGGFSYPELQFTVVNPAVVLDSPSRALADSTLGDGGADLLTTALQVTLGTWLGSLGVQQMPIMAFTVVPGVDSDDPKQLSAPPAIAWIDASTLGVFGYYRAAASGGDVNAKTAGDLTQPHEEFFYNQPGLFPTVAGRRAGLLLSPDAFRRVIGCPAVRDGVVHDLVFQRENATWLDWVRQHDGDRIKQDLSSRLVSYYTDELQSHPDESDQQHHEKAKARLDADIEQAIKDDAAQQENAWLASNAPAGPATYSGQLALDRATPPPCGSGSVEVTRMQVEHAQSDLVPMLRRLELELGHGVVTGTYHADGLLEVITGDVSFSADGQVEVGVEVDDFGNVISSAAPTLPNVDVEASGLTGTVQGMLETFFSHAWNVVLILVSLIVQQRIAEAIKAAGFPKVIAVDMPPQVPFPTRVAEVRIEPDALFAAAVVCREYRWNEFNPALIVSTTLESRTRTSEPEVKGSIHLEPTDYGCTGAAFTTTRTFWDETYAVRARLRDAPLPVTITSWTAELGNFSWNSIAGTEFLDPRPTWSSQPVGMADGELTLTGEVEHLSTLVGSYLNGQLTEAQVPVDVTGDAESGWHVTMHGADGNYYVRFSVDATDGDGKQWHGETFVVHEGDHLEVPARYYRYKADCDAKAAAAIQQALGSQPPHVGVAHVARGAPVESAQVRAAAVVRTLVAQGAPSAFEKLSAGRERFGPEFYAAVGKVQPIELQRVRR